MSFGDLENQSESWKSPGNLFLKRVRTMVVLSKSSSAGGHIAKDSPDLDPSIK